MDIYEGQWIMLDEQKARDQDLAKIANQLASARILHGTILQWVVPFAKRESLRLIKIVRPNVEERRLIRSIVHELVEESRRQNVEIEV